MDVRSELIKIRASSKKVLVVGLGISGIETAQFLVSCGISVLCVEREHEQEFLATSKFTEEVSKLKQSGAAIHFGIDGEEIKEVLDSVVLAVVSPGISLESSVCGALRRYGIPLLSEMELGIEIRGVPAIVVTGSNGKSTTVTLIHHLLCTGGIPALLCGNVGTPVVSGLRSQALLDQQSEYKVLVVEASSYQIESCRALKPKIGIFLNLSDNHLERHGTLDRYFEIKSRIFSLQDEDDVAIVNSDDLFVQRIIGRTRSRIFKFGMLLTTHKEDTCGAWIDYKKDKGIDRILVNMGEGAEEYELSQCRLMGLHNRYDISAAILASRYMGVAINDISKGIKTFHPLAHRLEISRCGAHPIFINDSKATTVAAAAAGFLSIRESFPDKQIVLLIGGLSKAGSWEPLMKYLNASAAKLRRVICFGQDGALLSSHCRAYNIGCLVAPTLKEAVRLSTSEAGAEDVVLLSPGCASFDEFRDFEERGDMFKSLVTSYIPSLW